MNIFHLVETLESQDVELWEENGSIRYRGPENVMTDEIKTVLGNSKQDVLSVIRSRITELPIVKHNASELYEQFPVTDIQGAYIIGRSNVYAFGNTGCFSYFELEFESLETEKLTIAWQKLLIRHPMLRCTFEKTGTQKFLKKVPLYYIKENNLKGAGKKKRESHLRSIRERMSYQGFDIEKWPLFEIETTIMDHTSLLHISVDMLIADSLSIQILLNEFGILYSKPETQLSKLDITFRDYILTEKKILNSKRYNKSRQYWLDRLENFPGPPELPLNKSYSNSKIQHPRFLRKTKRFEAKVWNFIKKRSVTFGLTPSTIILSAYAEIISRWSSISHFGINMTVLNRLPLHGDVINLVGDFTTVNLLEVKNEPGISFLEKAKTIQNRLWKDMDNRYFNGINVIREIVKKDGLKNFIMPVVYTSMLGIGLSENMKSNFINQGNMVYGISQTPQVWLDCQVMEKKQGLEINWDYVGNLFPDNLVEDMFNSFTKLIYELSQSIKPWEKISVVPLPERQMGKRYKISSTHEKPPKFMLHTMFEKNVIKYPLNEAIVTPNRRLSYSDLSNYSKMIAEFLVSRHVSPNTLVAIVMDKGWEQIAGTIGILKSGAAYLPISPDIPEQKLKKILSNGNVKVILTQSWIDLQINWPKDIELFFIDKLNCSVPSETITISENPENLAYVIYTSGSTGTPKGVMIDHHGAVNTILDINKRFEIGPGDKVLALSNLSFDLSVFDVFGVLAAGGTIVMIDPSMAKDPKHWLELMEQEKVTIWNSVPALMQMFVEYSQGIGNFSYESLRLILLSGDWIPLELPEQIRAVTGGETQLISLGGATEASIWSIFYPIVNVDPSWKSIPYGRPMTNQKFYVLNENMEECPDWVTGHLYISGLGLAKGYWQDNDKTNMSFIFHPDIGHRLYRTGDLGRYWGDGNIEFLGRDDFQVKINGYRIEMGEIETIMKYHPGVKDSVVTAVDEAGKNKFIAGYAVPVKGYDLSVEELMTFLKRKLDKYMLPTTLTILEFLPLTSTGKIDRKNLPHPNRINKAPEIPFIAPKSKLECEIARIVQEVLKIQNPSIHDVFFKLGANSLDIVKIHNVLSKKKDIDISVTDLFEYSTIHNLAQYISDNGKEKQSSYVVRASKRVKARKNAVLKRKIKNHSKNNRKGTD